MTGRRRALAIAGLVILLGQAGSSSALGLRHAESGPACGTVVIYNATARWGIRFYSSTFSAPTVHRIFRRSGTITLAIAPGGYSYQFHGPRGQARRSGSLVVGC